MNKQITDEDLSLAFKSGLSNLIDFEVNYVNINGSCFVNFKSFNIKRLSMHSCSKVSKIPI